MYELIYLSRALVTLDPAQMEGLLASSRTLNSQVSITGMLLHLHDPRTGAAFFVQLLEGPDPADVEQTYERIRRDELHTDVRVIHRGERSQRTFENWSMLARATSAQAALYRIAENLTDAANGRTTIKTIWKVLQDSRIARSLLIIAAEQHEAAGVRLS